MTAWRWATPGTRRPKAFTSGSPRTSAQATKPSRANVVTLMPPAVEAEPAPMNIRPSVTSSVPSRIWP